MIDMASEALLTLEQAAARLPAGRAGRPRHPTFLLREIMARRLEGAKVGKRWYTSEGALQRWSERLTAEALGGAPEDSRTGRPGPTAARVDRELAREGIGV